MSVGLVTFPLFISSGGSEHPSSTSIPSSSSSLPGVFGVVVGAGVDLLIGVLISSSGVEVLLSAGSLPVMEKSRMLLILVGSWPWS